MNFDTKLILILLVTISAAFASLNGECSGRTGICIKTSTCSSYGGQSYSGKCPSDPNDVKCCDSIPCSANGKSGYCVFSNQCGGETVSGKCPGGNDFKCCLSGQIDPTPTPTPTPGQKDSTFNGPCSGGGGACINTDIYSCDTRLTSGKCPGGNNVKCCVSGSRPSWYINQGDYKKILCSIPGTKPVDKSVSSSGCGPSSLAMAIRILTGQNVSPEVLFLKGYQDKLYEGNGFSKYALTTLGKKYGVSVTWTESADSAFSALQNKNPVIFNVRPEDKYHFTREGHYILLYGTKTENGVKKVYVFDPNGGNKYINVLFPFKKSDGGIEKAKGSFGIVKKA